MSTTPKDGGAAFPGIDESYAAANEYGAGYTGLNTYGGMSLRDWFAGKVMQAIITSLGDEKHRATMLKEGHNMKDIPPVAYGIADLMLAERSKGAK